ncbi:MAG: sigma-70 family RNA polymerase sigma factor [Clostridiales bacterium]|nr:sigma-70 family RNA polymerase sigma factor [Clostridiales bacterium]
MNDNEIIELFWAREEAALVQTRHKYGRLCVSVAKHILSDARDVEECSSDVLLKLWNTIPPERPCSLAAYIKRIARNQALDRALYNGAEMRKSALTESYEELSACLTDGQTTPEQYLEGQALREFLNRFLEGLPSEARIIFVRRYWYGERIREIAQALHYSEGKVKSSLYHTRNRLRKQMAQEGVSL